MQLLPIALALAVPIVALPTLQTPKPLEDPIASPFPIHHSCNATQQRQLAIALQETVELAKHAKNHILKWNNESAIYRKYFGDGPSITAIGAFDIIAYGNENVLFRCDNPDGNCALDGYAGHWRGENGTDETVICDLSYTTRRSLNTMCSQGYTVSGSKTNTFWAGDLIHRLYHLPAIGQGYVDHFSGSYEESLELAKSKSSESVRDTETLQLFALEAYAYDIAVPGVGCVDGEKEEKEETEDETSTPTSSTASSTTTDIPKSCHTHDGGELHCT